MSTDRRCAIRAVVAIFFAAGCVVGGSGALAQSVQEDLAIAVLNDRAVEVKRMLAAGADPNMVDRNGDPMIVIAARANSIAAMDMLLGAKVNVNARTKHGDTALMVAALSGRLDLAKKLRANGAEVRQPGWNALIYAAAGGQDEMVRYLLAEGGDINAVAANGMTALMMAAHEAKASTVDLLLARGADVNLRNQDGKSALDMARRTNEKAMVERLQRAGAR
jgi:ankyrin repeat protein